MSTADKAASRAIVRDHNPDLEHRDVAVLDWSKRTATLVDKIGRHQLVCAFHQHDVACRHSYVDHSRPHLPHECPFRAGDTVAMQTGEEFR